MRLIERLLRYIVVKLAGPPPRFKANDVVQLDENGPLMIVRNVKWRGPNSPYKVVCEWFDQEKKIRCEGVFEDSTLRPFNWSARK